ncbi:hypothetical protein PRIPAC_86939 [Pristionchus pacificus]|uniref:Uncharacterized protein n=1 Tax=Pristionchus pacificus TaxID=54126 RepID=A0A2A6BDD6_PRIPA|nr:hypothetical protein PRIPAC_86939 [Pristionchus pacificus]|eukprot:PDM63884.1 hypothetical protein PRIPAC_53667 [Pristionchus pacificus]
MDPSHQKKNIVSYLRSREMGHAKREYHRNIRVFYNVVTPKNSHRTILSTPSYIRAFSPDGRYLIGYGMNLKVVHIYEYNGVTSLPGNGENNLLNRILICRHTVDLGVAAVYQIFIENTLFTSDSSHLVVCTNSPVMDGTSRLEDLYVNNESPATTNAPLERYKIHAVSLERGEVTGTISHDMDRIQTFPSLQGRILCLLSLHRQCIILYSLSESGQFIPLKSIGHSMLDDDPIVDVHSNRLSLFLSAFKHRIFVFLYKRAKGLGNKSEMLRFLNEEGHVSSNNFILVLIEWENGEVKDVWTKCDERLLSAFEHSPWSFSQPFLSINRSPFHARNIPYNRNVFKAYDMARARSFSDTLPVRMIEEYRERILSYLPCVYSVHLNESPYLDPNLFTMDDSLAIALSWGRIKVENNHAYFSVCSRDCRYSQCIEFKVETPSSRQLSVLFHPHDPLILFFDRYRADQPITLYCPY